MRQVFKQPLHRVLLLLEAHFFVGCIVGPSQHGSDSRCAGYRLDSLLSDVFFDLERLFRHVDSLDQKVLAFLRVLGHFPSIERRVIETEIVLPQRFEDFLVRLGFQVQNFLGQGLNLG